MSAVSLQSPPSSPSSAPILKTAATKRRGKRLLVMGVLSLALAFFAPTLVALTPLRNLPLRMVFAGIDGTIHSGGALLGWFSAVEYRDVQVHDRQGAALAPRSECHGRSHDAPTAAGSFATRQGHAKPTRGERRST